MEIFLCDIYDDDLLLLHEKVQVEQWGENTGEYAKIFEENKFFCAAEEAARIELKESLEYDFEACDLNEFKIVVTEVSTGLQKTITVEARAEHIREFNFSAKILKD